MKGFLTSVCVVLVSLSIGGCCCSASTFDKPPAPPPTQAPNDYVDPECPAPSVPEANPPTEKTVPGEGVDKHCFEIDLSQAEIDEECELKTFDFDVVLPDERTIYGLAVVDENQLIVMLQGEVEVTRLEWTHENQTDTSETTERPKNLDMKMEGAPGEPVWFKIPSEAVDNGKLIAYY